MPAALVPGEIMVIDHDRNAWSAAGAYPCRIIGNVKRGDLALVVQTVTSMGTQATVHETLVLASCSVLGWVIARVDPCSVQPEGAPCYDR